MTISIRHPGGAGVTRIVSREVTLSRNGEELTVARFRLDGQARLVPGSVTDLPRPLRSAG